VWAVFEDPTTDTERNLWPIQLHRPRVEEEVGVSLGALQPRYTTPRGSVTTPTFEAPYAVAAWTAFVETAVVPPGTWLRYQLSEDGGQSWLYHDGDAWTDATSLEAANPWWDVHLNLDTFPVNANRLTVRAVLASEDGSRSPELDGLVLYYRQEDAATRFTFDPVPSPQRAGRPFSITLRATDELGRTIEGFSNIAALQTLAGQTSPAATPPFAHGSVTLEVSVAEVGPAVQLYAYAGAISGRSDPFEVTASTGARIERVSGDQQYGLAGTRLPEPLRVRVLDGDGEPAAAVAVTFAVTSGDGTLLSGAQAARTLDVTTDAEGIAAVDWTLGPRPGANLVEARLPGAEGSPVSFTARGDRNPDLPNGGAGDGGCSCRTTDTPAGHALLALLALLALSWLWRRRRRLPNP
jgi:MYXO-CTERM domain-containing protein